MTPSVDSEKRSWIKDTFGQIAPTYDRLNHILSFNIDRGWRRSALSELNWQSRPDGVYLDLCAGTLDVGAALAGSPGFHGRIIAADFSEPMLRQGRGKSAGSALLPVAADAVQLPLRDSSVLGAVVAFGIRNLTDMDAGLREVLRVLVPGSRFVVLEFSTPPSVLVRVAYRLYSHNVVPLVGRLLSGHGTAYAYLPDSVDRFPAPHALADRVRAAGFVNVCWRRVTQGIAAIHTAEKPAHEA